jgi:hypothetical protein
MKKHIITILLLFTIGLLSYGQTTDPLVGKCIMSAGENAKYLKDFRIQLGKAPVESELRFKANMSLWKNTKYRFDLCNTSDSKGQLILSIKDNILIRSENRQDLFLCYLYMQQKRYIPA